MEDPTTLFLFITCLSRITSSFPSIIIIIIIISSEGVKSVQHVRIGVVLRTSTPCLVGRTTSSDVITHYSM